MSADARPVLLLGSANMERLLQGALDDRFDKIVAGQGPTDREAEAVAMLTVGYDRVDAAMLHGLPRLKVIAVPGAGYERIDVSAAQARGVRVMNAGAVHAGDVADHAVALALAAIQRLPEQQAWVRDDKWRGGFPQRRRAVSAERFGIVGLGAIGTKVGDRLAPFGGQIAWWGPNPKPARWPRKASLTELARWCTTLIVAVRGDAAGLIDTAVIEAVGPDGIIVNIARGVVIDEDALIAALKDGRLGYAALDVFAQEPTPPARWDGVPHVILTPHSAGLTHQAMARLRDAAVQNLLVALGEGGPINEISA